MVQLELDFAGPGCPEEFRSELAALMCKMTLLTGPEMPECLFLVHSTQMCPIDIIENYYEKGRIAPIFVVHKSTPFFESEKLFAKIRGFPV